MDWTVWAVRPQLTERRSGLDRRSGRDRRVDPIRRAAAGTRRSDRRRTERRVTLRPRIFLPGFEQGWLCFEGGAQRRRLAPIPSGWESCDREALEAYCRRARPSSSSSRTA